MRFLDIFWVNLPDFQHFWVDFDTDQMPHRLRIIFRPGSKEDKSTREEDKKKKIESLEDNPIRKKAFENIIHSKFKENFQKFKMMSRGTEL